MASPPSPPTAFSLDTDTPGLSYWLIFLASAETAGSSSPGTGLGAHTSSVMELPSPFWGVRTFFL